jgi:hypothetical protein
MNETGSKTPVHLWIVGILSLLWNGFGGYDYVATKLNDRAYISSMAEPMGLDVDAALAYYQAFPLWMNVAWAVGVWGAVAGSVLLLLRSGFAYYAFVLSLVGIAVAAYYQIANPMPGLADNTVGLAFSVAIVVITALLAWYARAMAKRGVLR